MRAKFSSQTDYMIDDDAASLSAIQLTRSVSHRNWYVHIRNHGWRRQRYLPPRLCDVPMPTEIALDSNFNLLLKERILIFMCRFFSRHVITGINHGWVCVVDIKFLVRYVAAARQHTRDLLSTTNNHP